MVYDESNGAKGQITPRRPVGHFSSIYSLCPDQNKVINQLMINIANDSNYLI